MNLGPVTKALLGAASAATAASTAALQDGHVELLEWMAIGGGALVGFVGVYFANNERVLGYAKTLASLLVSVTAGVLSALADKQGISSDELTGLIVAVIGAFVVSQAPNAEASDGDLGEDIEVDPSDVPEATVPEVPYPGGDDGTGLDADRKPVL